MKTEKQDKHWRVFQISGMLSILSSISSKYPELLDFCYWAEVDLLKLKGQLKKKENEE